MSFDCGFFDSVGGDRAYNAEQMSRLFDGIIRDGIFEFIGDKFKVTPGDGFSVNVGTGRAWFDHTWNYNDSLFNISLEPADVALERIDAIVLEVNASIGVRENSLKVVTGEANGEALKPALTNDATVHQHALAYITVHHNAQSITDADIEIVVGKTECPYVTGPLETVDISEQFKQWNSQFDTWFKNIQAQLSGDVAANLQREIEERVRYTDVANGEQVADATNDRNYLSPKAGLAFLTSRHASAEEVVAALANNKWVSPSDLDSFINSNVIRTVERTVDINVSEATAHPRIDSYDLTVVATYNEDEVKTAVTESIKDFTDFLKSHESSIGSFGIKISDYPKTLKSINFPYNKTLTNTHTPPQRYVAAGSLPDAATLGAVYTGSSASTMATISYDNYPNADDSSTHITVKCAIYLTPTTKEFRFIFTGSGVGVDGNDPIFSNDTFKLNIKCVYYPIV